MFPLSYMANTAAAAGLHETYEFRVDDETFHLVVDEGTVSPRAGAAPEPDLVITMDAETLRGLFGGGLDPIEALSSGRVSAEGPPDVLQHALAVLAG